MTKTFVISDTHFGHKNILTFFNDDGSKLRPWTDVDEMNQAMIDNWNSVVRDGDKVYHLGDVVMNKSWLPILSELNGRKTLIAGNHDIFNTKEYLKYFDNVRAYRVVNNFILSHIPIHESQKYRFNGNIHGHTHGRTLPDPFYRSVCVEQINYTPVLLDSIFSEFEGRD